MKSKVVRLSYRIGLNRSATAKVFRNNGDREYGIDTPLTYSTIGRIGDLTYKRKFKTQAVLSPRSIAIFIRLKRDKS